MIVDVAIADDHAEIACIPSDVRQNQELRKQRKEIVGLVGHDVAALATTREAWGKINANLFTLQAGVRPYNIVLENLFRFRLVVKM